MKEDPEDRRLHLRFRKLEKEVESFAPPYSIPEPKPRRVRIRFARPVPVFAVTAVVAAVAIGIGLRDTRPPLSPAFDAVLWRGQTDFLLDTPGRDLLFTVPTVDDVPDLDAPGILDDADPHPFG